MFCSNCGNQLIDGARFCGFCGAQIAVAPDVNEEIVEYAEEITEVEAGAVDIEADAPSITELPRIAKPAAAPSDGKTMLYREGQFAYARLRKIDDEKEICHFVCEDNVSIFAVPIEIYQKIYRTEPEKGQRVWALLQKFEFEYENTHQRKYQNRLMTRSLSQDEYEKRKHQYGFDYCKEAYQKNDIVYAPISRIDEEKELLFVNLTPYYNVLVNRKSLSKPIEQYRVGEAGYFRIQWIDEEKGRMSLEELSTYGETKRKYGTDNYLWRVLPVDLNNVIIPKSILNIIKTSPDIKERLFNGETDEYPVRNRLNELYQDAYSKKEIEIKETKTHYYIVFDSDMRDQNGTPINIGLKQSIEEDKWFVNLLGFSHVGFYFNRQIYVPDWRKHLENLSELALEGENWDYGTSGASGDKYILRQYLIFTYYKAYLDGLIEYSEDRSYAVFNTGLVDSSYDDIYCCLMQNDDKKDFFERPWQISLFACWGKGEGKILNKLFVNKPVTPRYIDSEHLEDIFFDTTKSLDCDYEHIIEDNLLRLPIQFIKHRLAAQTEILALIGEIEKNPKNTRLLQQLKHRIADNGEYIRYLQEGLQSAVRTAINYCKWNYKTAIPIFYPRNNRISLLLPLMLTSKNSADVALVVEKLANGNYQGQTILTLDMAYLDARQICRPNSEWLTLSDIKESSEDDEEDEIEE